jgi:uncharacterized membrane protein
MPALACLDHAGLRAACAYPAVTSRAADPAMERYEARGNEPGWLVRIAGTAHRLYRQYGEKKISLARPGPRPSFNGRRYESTRLHRRHHLPALQRRHERPRLRAQVSVTATARPCGGCGGERRPDWDL